MAMPSRRRQKVFLAALAHETNTFSPLPTTLRSFSEGVLHHAGDASTLAAAREFPGYVDVLDVAERQGDECIAGLCAWAQPGGALSREDYERLRHELLEDLRRAAGVDFVFLVLHGAMVAEGYPDCEGDLLMSVRAIVGPSIPVGALLDLHGNVSEAMVTSGAVLVACKEYPHTDYAARTEELYAILSQAASTGAAPGVVMRRVPMMSLLGTTEGPMRDFVRSLKDHEAAPGILSVSAMHGFPWSDTPDTGASILVVHDGGAASARQRAEATANGLARALWKLREQGSSARLPLDDAITAALAAWKQAGGPVVMADGSDNPGGGAACDSTFVLRALVERGVTNAALGMIWDPQAVRLAADAGPGARLPLRIGGKVGPMSGPPLDVDAEVIAVRDDARQRSLGGVHEKLGLAVAIRAAGIDVVLNSTRQQVFSPDCFTELGIDPTRKDLVVVKSTQHFRAGFDAIATHTVYCDAPGSLNQDLRRLPYRRLRRPTWPIDPPELVLAVGF